MTRSEVVEFMKKYVKDHIDENKELLWLKVTSYLEEELDVPEDIRLEVIKQFHAEIESSAELVQANLYDYDSIKYMADMMKEFAEVTSWFEVYAQSIRRFD